MPKICVILVNFNGWRDTLECLESLRNLNYRNVQVIVVDNCSGDDSLLQLHAQLSKVEEFSSVSQVKRNEFRLEDGVTVNVSTIDWQESSSTVGEHGYVWPLAIIESDCNRGFSGGNNIGIRFALSECNAHYCWLLNNDTIVDRYSLDELYRTFRERESAEKPLAFCGSVIMDFDERNVIQSFGGGLVNPYFGTTKSFLAGTTLKSLPVGTPCRVPDYISGCSLLLKASQIDRTGLLDEAYFLYWEDTEWSYRCKSLGMDIAVASESKIWHRRGSTSTRYPIAGFYNTRNSLWFFRQYFPGTLIFCLLLKPLSIFAVALKNLNFAFLRESMRGYLAFCKTWSRG
tara:strand:- start:22909 stop:23940 length:1032 start_codon:yes stop_codon:yes gene_type:complete